jgi:glycosyltransferase involved in cell wall biosynthesis
MRRDPAQKSDWSGTPYWTTRHLKDAGHSVDVIRGEPAWAHWLLAPMKVLAQLMGREYLIRHADLYHHILRRSLRLRLSGRAYDVVLLQDAILAAAVDHPNAVFWCDAQVETLFEAYLPGYWGKTWNASAALRRERDAVSNARWVICASSWARNPLAALYPDHAEKMPVIPFPENMPAPDDEAVERAIADRTVDELRLLFIGVDWARKGGDRAMAVLEALRAQGVPASLTIIGGTPLTGEVPDGVRQLGFLDKSTPEGLAHLHGELLRSHFLLLPSRAEAWASRWWRPTPTACLRSARMSAASPLWSRRA